MARPIRLRRPPLKYLEDENILQPKSRNKIAEANSENQQKGNLLAGKRTVVAQASQLSVLRDRTNLPQEPFKVDILVKKGADDKTVKKTAKATRQTAESAVLEEVENKAPSSVTSLRQTEAKNLQLVKETTKILPLVKENTQNTSLQKENTRNMPLEKEDTQNVPLEKEKSEDVPLVKEKTKNVPLTKEKAKDVPLMKEKTQNVPVENEDAPNVPLEKEKSENVPLVKQKAKKLKPTKVAPTLDNEGNSLVIESENATDSDDTTKMRSVRAAPKKIRKRIVSSKLSLSKQSEKSIENRKKKSLRRSPKLGKKEDVPTTSDATAGKKFFKSKGVHVAYNERNLLGKKIGTSKRRKNDVREKPRVSTSFRLRQTTLSESFAKQATKKNLRPRLVQKNYHEQSTVLEKTVANDKDTIKGPVYKTAKLKKSDDEGSEIYEFHFDSNDSRERLTKKRKRKVGKNVVTKNTRTKASGSKKTISKEKVAAKRAIKENKVEEPRTEFPAASDKAMDTNVVPKIVVSDFDLLPVTTGPTQPKKVEPQPNKFGPQPEKAGLQIAKPTVVESVELTGEKRINLTSTPQLTKSTETNARPVRTTNAFDIRPSLQYRTMLSHALLNKSLSPITKASENFDTGSPWRPPEVTGQQFSRVRNVVQSTPQVRKFSAMLEKNRNSVDSKVEQGSTAGARMNKIVEKDEKNDNVEQANIKPTPQKVLGLAKSPRKFGTEISNMNISIPNAGSVVINQNSDKPEQNRGSPRKIATIAPPPLANLSESRISVDNDAVDDFHDYDDYDNYDDYDDKENSIQLFVSPKKSLKSPKKLVAKRSPLRPFTQVRTATKENWEPQPGPSGLQKRSPLSQARILKQSNLNNFLNIDEVPTSTRISTAHGIFADVHSTPIIRKPVKMIAKEPNVENAFGFDDNGDTDIDLSPIKGNLFSDLPTVKVAKKIATKKQKIEEKNGATVPTRFSIGEMKKHLRQDAAKDKNKDDFVKRIGEEEKENRGSREEKSVSENIKVNDAITFTDTFDLLAEAAEANKENVEEIPLFADLEPVHFKQPPRHSYKRKRLAFNFSEDEEDDREAFTGHKNRGTKKRKISKVEKERQKKMEKWAEELNHTFEEIDHYDLVVE